MQVTRPGQDEPGRACCPCLHQVLMNEPAQQAGSLVAPDREELLKQRSVLAERLVVEQAATARLRAQVRQLEHGPQAPG